MLPSHTGIATLSMREDILVNDTTLSGNHQFIKTDALGRVWVTNNIEAALLTKQIEIQALILTELRVITAVLTSGLNVNDDPEVYRNDSSFNTNLQ